MLVRRGPNVLRHPQRLVGAGGQHRDQRHQDEQQHHDQRGRGGQARPAAEPRGSSSRMRDTPGPRRWPRAGSSGRTSRSSPGTRPRRPRPGGSGTHGGNADRSCLSLRGSRAHGLRGLRTAGRDGGPRAHVSSCRARMPPASKPGAAFASSSVDRLRSPAPSSAGAHFCDDTGPPVELEISAGTRARAGDIDGEGIDDGQTFVSRSGVSARAVASAGRFRSAGACAVSPVPTPRDWSRQDPVQYPDPGRRRTRPPLPPLHRRQHRDQAAPYRHALGRRARRGTASGAISCGATSRTTCRCAGSKRTARVTDVPQSVGLQQRQHLRLRGPAALVRARRAARRPLRAERHGDGHRREVPGEATELAERRRRASGRRHLVHRSDLRHPRQLRRLQGRVRAAGGRLPGRSEDRRRSTRSPTKSAGRTGSASRPTTRSSTSPTPARRERSRSGTSTARRCATASGSCSSTCRARARRRSPTASAATWTATSGPAPGLASR